MAHTEFYRLTFDGAQRTLRPVRRSRAASRILWHNGKPLPMAIDWFPLRLSLEVAALATLISLILGIWLAWLLANKHFRGKDILDALTTLPLALPPTVLGYYLLVVIGRASWIGQAWEKMTGSPLVFTWRAAVIASTLHAIPLLVKSSRAELGSIRMALILAGQHSACTATHCRRDSARIRAIPGRFRRDAYGRRQYSG